jgi:hypothetical protein
MISGPGPAIVTLLSAAGEAEVNHLALCSRLAGAERRSEEDRAAEALIGRPEIGDEFRDALEDPAGYLGGAPEKALS